jgi:hypothetical protein
MQTFLASQRIHSYTHSQKLVTHFLIMPMEADQQRCKTACQTAPSAAAGKKVVEIRIATIFPMNASAVALASIAPGNLPRTPRPHNVHSIINKDLSDDLNLFR